MLFVCFEVVCLGVGSYSPCGSSYCLNWQWQPQLTPQHRPRLLRIPLPRLLLQQEYLQLVHMLDIVEIRLEMQEIQMHQMVVLIGAIQQMHKESLIVVMLLPPLFYLVPMEVVIG